MPATQTFLRTRKPVDYGVTPGTTTLNRRKHELWRRFANVALGALGGVFSDSVYTLGYTASDPAAANSGLAVSGASGTVGVTVNGVAVTVTHATSDTNDAALIAAAINASTNALVLGFLIANNLTATITLASVAAGQTVQVGSTIFTARSGAAPTNVLGAGIGTFDISGTNTQDAAALAGAINAHPECSRFFVAVPVAAVVRLFARNPTYTLATNTFAFNTGPGAPPNTITSQASTMTVSANGVAAGAFVGLISPTPGIQGNAVTIAASGTGITTLGSETRLARGVGPTVFITSET